MLKPKNRIKELKEVFTNAVADRATWFRRMLDPNRDFDKECGHPSDISITDYTQQFKRGDIANRVVSLFPQATWSKSPEIFEQEDPELTPFEKAWDELNVEHSLISELKLADTLSGIGRFGIIILGIDDGKQMDQPVAGLDRTGMPLGKNKYKLLYLRPLDESLVEVNKLDLDTTSPRFGRPLSYNIRFDDNQLPGGTVTSKSKIITSAVVHWHRVIHIVDNRMNSKVYGQPRMQLVYNRLLDIHKVAGGSAEMFWKGAFPGYALEASPGLDPTTVTIDKEATREEMENYMMTLKRYIAVTGMTVKSLAPQVADPKAHVETQIRLVAMAMSVPWRIFMGVEIGQLAGEQDILAWNERVAERQVDYVTPFVLRPFVERLIAFGCLPTPPKGVKIFWPDLNTPTQKDRADFADKWTTAATKYVQGGVSTLIPPFHWLTLIGRMSPDEATSVLKEAEAQRTEDDPLIPVVDPNAQAEAAAGAPAAKGAIGGTSAAGATAAAKTPTSN